MFSAFKSPVLLATDGTPEAEGAVAVGAELARARSAVLRMVTVLEPGAYPFSGSEQAASSIASANATSVLEAQLRTDVSAQVGAFLGDKASHEVFFTRGRVVPTIVAESRKAGAGLILLGLHPHGILERLAGEETALRVARTAGLPVLCVTPSLRQLPRSIIAAVDFSPASVRAAREVLTLAPHGATITLAHVRPPAPDRNAANARANYSSGVRDALARLQQSIPTDKDITVNTVTLEGQPVPELLNYAIQSGAELIALGAHRHSFVGRLVLGSVATDLLRAATVSLFIVPPTTHGG